MIINSPAQTDIVRIAADQSRTDKPSRQDRSGRSGSLDKSPDLNTEHQDTKTESTSKTASQDTTSSNDAKTTEVTMEFSVLVEAALNAAPVQTAQPITDQPPKETAELDKSYPQLRVSPPTAALREQTNQESSGDAHSSGDENTQAPLIPLETQDTKSSSLDFPSPGHTESGPLPQLETPSMEASKTGKPSSAALTDLGSPVEQARQSWAPVLIKRASSSVEARMDTPAGQVLVTGRMTGSEATVTVALPAALRPQLSQDGQMPEFQDGTYRWDWQQERDERPKKDSEES